MEDPIPYDVVGLPTPPLDDGFPLFSELGDVSTGDYGVDLDFDFDFSVDDLSFADELLLQQPDPNSEPNCGDWVNPNLADCENNGSFEDGVRVYDCSSNQEISSSKDSNSQLKFDSPEIGCSKSNSGELSGNFCDRDVSSDDCDNNAGNLDFGRKSTSNELAKSSNLNSVSKSKRKKDVEHDDHAAEIRSNKFRRSNSNANVNANANAKANTNGVSSDENVGGGDDEDEKRKARLLRNRESAHLSRQRKKQYVEELEEKVKSMVSTIADLNGKISYFMTENASLRQQLSGGVVGPAMYPMAPMPYPWMPCPPGYMNYSRGSNVPLVPIPRVRPQQPASAPKVKKPSKGDSKTKTKKVASVSLLGLLFFMLLFGGILPMVSVRYGTAGNKFGAVHKGTVFKFDHGRVLQQSNSSNGNTSEPLVASLYVPRNDRMVKIDGNLIIHSILASERAMASNSVEGPKTSEAETGLVVHGSHPPYPTPGPGSNDWRHPHLDRNHNGRQRALGSGSSDFTPIGADGRLQQWFREGLAGPMLSSGMCTEVFQFEVSPTPGSIVPATSSMANITSEDRLNYTRPTRTKNRRILPGHALPLNDRNPNTTAEPVQPHERNEGLQSNKSSSSVVVSVLVDPREVGDGSGEGVLGSKTLSRIFVVVLIDSVKYVTYSCMLPFMGSSSNLITT